MTTVQSTSVWSWISGLLREAGDVPSKSTGRIAGAGRRLDRVCERLGLDAVAAAALAVVAAPEVEPGLAGVLRGLGGDVDGGATARVVVQVLEPTGMDGRAILEALSDLHETGAITSHTGAGDLRTSDRPLRLSDLVACEVAGGPLPGAAGPLDVVLVPPPEVDLGRADVVVRLRALLDDPEALPVVIVGPDGPGLLATAAGRSVAVVPGTSAPDPARLRDASLVARLAGALLVHDLQELDGPEQARVLRALAARPERLVSWVEDPRRRPVLPQHVVAFVEVPLPPAREREVLWRAWARVDEAHEVAAKFRLSAHQVERGAAAARAAARGRGAARPSPADLDLGARQASTTTLGSLADLLAPTFGWDDLVLPQRARATLASISAYLRHRDTVLDDWGLGQASGGGQGLKVLFAGDSGTGKTMAAQVLARDLGLAIYRIDLAAMVSKYVGETEKNLDRVFAAAEGSNAVLFFDEADALFGKRSDIGDANDRYANIEVAYLLQKMDAYSGAVLLTTNFRQNIDDAFVRRLDFIMDFPFPEHEDRLKIWARLLGRGAPRAADVDLDFLARQFKLSGGNIRNAVLAAAFMAADAGVPIGMAELVRGVGREYEKLGRLTLMADFGQYHALLQAPADRR